MVAMKNESPKEVLVERIHEWIDDASQSIDQLSLNMQYAEAEVKIKIKDQIHELKHKKNLIEMRLEKLKEDSAQDIQNLSDETKQTCRELIHDISKSQTK